MAPKTFRLKYSAASVGLYDAGNVAANTFSSTSCLSADERWLYWAAKRSMAGFIVSTERRSSI